MKDEILIQDIEKICAYDLPWNELKNKSVLITGATGFIGSFIVHLLMYRNSHFEENVKIYALGRNVDTAKKRFIDYWNNEEFIFITCDLCEPFMFHGNIDYIFHCASNASPDQYISDPVNTMKTNLEGTINLLDFAIEHNVRKFIYTSTIEVYGKTTNLEKIKETDFGYIDSMLLRSNYPLSKKTAEMLCVAYAKQYGMDIRIGRIPYSYGPGMKKTDKKVATEFLRNVVHNENLVLKSSGLQKRSYCYLADVVSALFTIMFLGKSAEAYNIASEKSVTTIVGLASKLVSLFPEKNLKLLYNLPEEKDKKQFTFIENAVLDSSKIERLGWEAAYDLDEGLKRTIWSMEKEDGEYEK